MRPCVCRRSRQSQGGCMKGILGRKVGMTQLLTASGDGRAGDDHRGRPCYVTQIKTQRRMATPPFSWVFEETKPKRLTKGEVGHLRRRNANLPALRTLREFRMKDVGDYTGGPEAAGRCFRGRRAGGCEGHLQGPRVPGRREAPRFPRWAAHARPVRPPAGAGRQQLGHDAGPGLQGQAHGRSYGQCAGDGLEPAGCAGGS